MMCRNQSGGRPVLAGLVLAGLVFAELVLACWEMLLGELKVEPDVRHIDTFN
jgi:hypothetical protein